MFNKEKTNQEDKEIKDESKETNVNYIRPDLASSDKELNEEEERQEVVSTNHKAVVVSKTLYNVKVIVVFKKIVPPTGPVRDQFNIYQFDNDGRCVMLERDAILFWKERRATPGMEEDVEVFDNEFEDGELVGGQYDFDEVKKLFKIESEDLATSQQRTPTP